MRTSANDAAMYLHDNNLTALAADSSITETLGRIGTGGLALVLLTLMAGLIKSKKADGKPWILVLLGMSIAASFAHASGLLPQVNKIALSVTGMLGDLGFGTVYPAAAALITAIVLWLFPMKTGMRIAWAFLAYVTFAAADGTLFTGIETFINNLVSRFNG